MMKPKQKPGTVRIVCDLSEDSIVCVCVQNHSHCIE